MTLPGHDRYDYAPITARKPFDWPGGKRLAVYFGLNLEHFAFGDGARRQDYAPALMAAFRAAEGAVPEGWLSPWIAESAVTPDLLAEAGYRYTLNWCRDDQPVWMRTRAGRLLSSPIRRR